MFSLTKDNLPIIIQRAKDMMEKTEITDLPLSAIHRDYAIQIIRATGASYASAVANLPPLLCPPLFPQWEEKESLRIKYYDNERALERDRPMVTTLGRWLTGLRIFSNIDIVIDEVRANVTTGEVKFAITAEDIASVYRYGPNSCMSEYKGYYDLGAHGGVVSVPSLYAYPHNRTEIVPESGNNLAVAYMGDITVGSARVFSRALCDMKRMTFNRIYGDVPRMFRALRKLGFTQHKDLLLGVPLTRIDDKRRDLVLCPYLDAKVTPLVKIEEDHIKLSLDGRHKFSTEKYLSKARREDYEGDNDDNDDDDDDN